MPKKKTHRQRPHRWRRPRRWKEPRLGNVCSYCGRKFTEFPYRCNYCGERLCSDHHLPEAHECLKLPPRGWSVRSPEPPISPPVSGSLVPIIRQIRFKILNGVKYLGGGLFSIGCIITWIAFIGPLVLLYAVPDLAFDPLIVWEMGILLTCVGFTLFLLGWIFSKLSSPYGLKYRDWRAKRVVILMVNLFVLTTIIWLISRFGLKTGPALTIFADIRSIIWIFAFLIGFISIGSYMKKIREIRGILYLFYPVFTLFGALGIFLAFAFVWYGIPLLIQNPQILSELPPNYYDTAKVYVTLKYGNFDKTYSGLESFLMKLEPFPAYSMNVFDCSESSALLEWLLEGAGFNTSIATSSIYRDFPHTWVVVNLPNGKYVKIEATYFTQNYYNPSSIVSGRQQLGFGGDVDYENPAEVFDSPIDAVRRLVVYVERSEWDWWNAAPYNSVEPFSKWD